MYYNLGVGVLPQGHSAFSSFIDFWGCDKSLVWELGFDCLFGDSSQTFVQES